MKPRVLTGSKQEIADTVSRLAGKIREAIVFVEEPSEPGKRQSQEDIICGNGRFLSQSRRCGLFARGALP